MNSRSYILIAGSGTIAAALMRVSRPNIECVFIIGTGKADHEKSAAELHDELYGLEPITTVEYEEVPIKKLNHNNFTYDWRKNKRR